MPRIKIDYKFYSNLITLNDKYLGCNICRQYIKKLHILVLICNGSP